MPGKVFAEAAIGDVTRQQLRPHTHIVKQRMDAS